MAKVTRIKASDSPAKREERGGEPPVAPITRKQVVLTDKKQEREKQRARAKSEKQAKRAEREKAGKRPFILIRPFVAFGRYLRASWHEIRQVRWPNRKATWKMVLAVIVYTALFVVLITLLDLLFKWIFGLILG